MCAYLEVTEVLLQTQDGNSGQRARQLCS